MAMTLYGLSVLKSVSSRKSAANILTYFSFTLSELRSSGEKNY